MTRQLSKMNETWTLVANIDDLDEEEPVAAKVNGQDIAVYLLDGQFCALDNECPHAYVMLSDGFIEEGHVICPKHQATFEILTGKCIKGPGKLPPDLPPLTMHDVRVEDTKIFVRLSSED